MRILNLAGNIQDIPYHINYYPDGQRDLVIENVHILREEQVPIQIRTRLTNFEELNLLICAVKSLQNAKVKKIQLYISYLLGARSDRMFQEGGVSYLRDIVAPILNSLNLEKITVLDPHNPEVTAALINNLTIKLPHDFIDKSLNEIHQNYGDYTIVVPDLGAYKRLRNLSSTKELLLCNKTREEGNLTGVQLLNSFNSEHNLVIIDDLCDGGGTFINIAEEICNLNWNKHLFLICTHGIFSKGIDNLRSYFERVYTTNSYSDNKLDKDFIVKYKII